MQPMDKRVIATMKRIYKTPFLLAKNKECSNLKEFWKNYTVLNNIYDFISAWNCIKPLAFVKSRTKLFPSIETFINKNICEEENDVMLTATLVDQIMSIFGLENVNEGNAEEWLKCDASELGREQLTKVEKMNKVMGVNENEGEKI